MFVVGQRWYSEGEPELGLGIVQSLEDRNVQILYPLCGERRIYNSKTSPLKRFQLEIDDNLVTESGEELQILSIENQNDILFYICDDAVIPEMNLQSKIDLNGPLDRLLAKNFDVNSFSQLRYDSYLNYRKYESFPYKGFLGPKVRLIPHQLFVANQVLKMDQPKAMLCDEVGLGKTIEACLVLNSLLQQERVENVLIVVPDSLINQWFIELYKKFNLQFSIMDLLDEETDFTTLSKFIIGRKQLEAENDLTKYISTNKWDMLIMDESHQIKFNQEDNTQVDLYKSINSNCVSTLLLSATPEVLGEENLFHQLEFLDPIKYSNFQKFKDQYFESLHISKLLTTENLLENNQIHTYFNKEELSMFSSEDEVKKALIDRYGTGRSYFRNSRVNLERYHRLFTDRILHQHPLTIDGKIDDKSVFKAKLMTIIDIVNDCSEDKVLILCHSKDVVLKIQKELLKIKNYNLAVFHSDQSLLERDRQAAYFADEEGAQVLICTEVGSEGRNFEFSSNLILFDLPKLPDQLEQRIGRLDRIGQINDIKIHIPYIRHTFEEILFRWYHEVLNAIESSAKGAHSFYERHRHQILELIEHRFDETKLNQFIDSVKDEYQHYAQELESGRNLIIETNSYQHEQAKEIVKSVREYENQSPLDYMTSLCEQFGILIDEHAHLKHFICPTDNMLIPSFAGLSSEGQSISFDRDYALKYDNIEFCSWEHPFVKTGFDLLLNSSLGNMTVACNERIPRNIYFETIFTMQCSDSIRHLGSLYLPFTPLRVLMDIKGSDKTKELSKRAIDDDIESIDSTGLEILHQIPKDAIQQIIKKAHSQIKTRVDKYINSGIQEVESHYSKEYARQNQLVTHPDTKQKLLKQLENERDSVKRCLYNANIKLDSIRIVLPKS